ncbi:hypothetical protein L1049_020848 [Liquidambar formosana]|uniref:Possible tRNA binding domain-containing protein n=1 Tax=Liquidambar formosana TaxID=63359 RepID=A0AAP0X7S6_LIQFO
MKPPVSLENESSMSVKSFISPDDFTQLEVYTENGIDYGKVRDLVPVLAQCYFEEKLPITLSHLQASILLCMGLQRNDITYIEGSMKLERQQILSLFRKVMKKFHKYLYDLLTKEFDSNFPQVREVTLLPHSVSVDDDLDDGAKQVIEMKKIENIDVLNPESLQQFSIADREAEFEHSLRHCTMVSPSGLISVKSN